MTLLAARDLTVAIEDRCLVEGLNLDVEQGEIWGVLGRNGVGKTTLLMTLAGILTAHAGEVLLDNQNILLQHRRAIARRLGMLVQHTRYAFEATCLEMVLVGLHPHIRPWEPEKRVHRERALALLTEVGLAGLEHRIASTLSGGEARRLALATLAGFALTPLVRLLVLRRRAGGVLRGLARLVQPGLDIRNALFQRKDVVDQLVLGMLLQFLPPSHTILESHPESWGQPADTERAAQLTSLELPGVG